MNKINVRKDSYYLIWKIFAEIDDQYFYESRDTWEEAMQRADELSRTIIVTLPSKPRIVRIGNSKSALVTTDKNGRAALYIMDDSGEDKRVVMKTKHLEPLALALLAHAYARKEQ